MKNLGFLFLVSALALTLVACGNKDGGNNSGSSSNPFSVGANGVPKIETRSGYLDVSQPIAQVGNVRYQIPQTSYQVIGLAFQRAQAVQPPIQPVLINGVYKYKAKITGSIAPQYGMQQGGIQSGVQQSYGSILNITQAVIVR